MAVARLRRRLRSSDCAPNLVVPGSILIANLDPQKMKLLYQLEVIKRLNKALKGLKLV